MKLKLLLALVALAGLASALALASPTQAGDGKHGSTTATTGTSTGTSTGKKDDDGDSHGDNHHGKSSCQKVELRGTGSGSIALTVTKANDSGSSMVGKVVPLTVPAGSSVGATACVDAAGVLTLRSLVVKPPVAAPTTTTTTTTTTTSNTTNAPHSHHHSHHH